MICSNFGSKLFAVVLVLAAADGRPAESGAQYDPHAPEPIGRMRGSLVIHGGGTLQDTLRERFVELAGGGEARIVVVPTADARADDENADRWLEHWQKSEAASVVL